MRNIDHYLKSIKWRIGEFLYSRLGWQTNRHFIVIESDDWGSIRMPSRATYDRLLAKGIRVDQCHYCKYDSIASELDLQLLFEVLNKFKDINGRPVVITANAVVANPDFERIREGGFHKYYYKTIDKGLPEIKGCGKSLQMWKEGLQSGCFQIQYHGREHLNVPRWMKYLQGNYPETKYAFDNGVYGISTTITKEQRRSFLPAFDFETKEEENLVKEIAINGLAIFENIFGYKSKSFIAPNYVQSDDLNLAIKNVGVDYIQGARSISMPRIGKKNYKKKFRRNGISSIPSMLDLVRNVAFEPSSNSNIDWVDYALKEISKSFAQNHPAVICSHRVNFIGSLNEENRDNNLKALYQLLDKIVTTWPDVEFLSSDQLGDIIKEDISR